MNVPAERPVNPLVKLHEEMEARTPQFLAALPAHIPVERFKRVLLTAVQNNPVLATADRRTFFNSAMRAAQDGLLPDGREGAMVIYKTKVKEGGREFWIEAVQWLPMIGGLRKKVRNSREIATWDAHVVYERDQFDYELGFDAFIKHKPFMGGDPGKVIAAYSVATLKSGEKSCEVMTVWQIERVRAMSKAKDSGPWRDHYSEMCRKTVARRHSKVLPMSSDLDDLIRRDDDLYDIGGAGDKAIAAQPKRPQLADFTGMPQNAPMTEDPKAAKAMEKADPETGELPAEDSPVPDFSAADAYQLGHECRARGGVVADCPKHMSPEHQEAWREGFKAADDEMSGDGP